MTDQDQPWYAAYPQAKSNPDSISRSEVLQLLKQRKQDADFVLVDLRRTDYEVCRCVHLHSCIHDRPCVCILTHVTGRDHNEFNQSPSPKPLSDDPIAVCPLPRCWRSPSRLVLR
jgi:hypothetical protein